MLHSQGSHVCLAQPTTFQGWMVERHVVWSGLLCQACIAYHLQVLEGGEACRLVGAAMSGMLTFPPYSASGWCQARLP